MLLQLLSVLTRSIRIFVFWTPGLLVVKDAGFEEVDESDGRELLKITHAKTLTREALVELDWPLRGWLAKCPKEEIWVWKGLRDSPGETHEVLTHWCWKILFMVIMSWKSSITRNMVYIKVQYFVGKLHQKYAIFNFMKYGAFLNFLSFTITCFFLFTHHP